MKWQIKSVPIHADSGKLTYMCYIKAGMLDDWMFIRSYDTEKEAAEFLFRYMGGHLVKYGDGVGGLLSNYPFLQSSIGKEE